MKSVYLFLKKYYSSLLFCLIILILSTVSVENSGSPSWLNIKNLDKIIHLLMYLFLSLVVAYEIMKNNKEISIKNTLLYVIVVVLTYGGFMEIIQEYFTSTRSGDWIDFAFDGLGVFLAGIVLLFFKREGKELVSE